MDSPFFYKNIFICRISLQGKIASPNNVRKGWAFGVTNYPHWKACWSSPSTLSWWLQRQQQEDQTRTILHLALPQLSPWFTQALVWHYIRGSSVQILPNKSPFLSKGSQSTKKIRVFRFINSHLPRSLCRNPVKDRVRMQSLAYT